LWHCGQMLRAGLFRTHALARRLRLLALDVFFFGTAIVVPVFSVMRSIEAGVIGETPCGWFATVATAQSDRSV
jgi:hypothetical protein